MKPTTMQVQALEHTDVRNNKLLYLKIQYANNDVLINIGKKTYDSITALAEMPINIEPQNEPKTKKEVIK